MSLVEAAWPRRLPVVVALLVALVWVPDKALASDVGGQITDVTVGDQVVEFDVAVDHLPGGGQLDGTSLTVSIEGVETGADVTSVVGDRAVRRVVLVIDVSGSMRGAGIEAARGAALAFLDTVPADVEVGIVSFNDRPYVGAAPSLDRVAARAAVSALQASRETALYDAVAVGVATLGPTGERTMVLLSDGGDTVSLSTLEAARGSLQASGVRAEVVGFRTDESQDQVLAQLAEAGRGRVSAVGDQASLVAAFAEAATVRSSRIRVLATVPDGVEGDVPLDVMTRAGSDVVSAGTRVVIPVRGESAPASVTPVHQAGTSVLMVGPRWFGSPWPVVVAIGLVLLVVGLLALSPLLRSRKRSRVQRIELYTSQGQRRGFAPSTPDRATSRTLTQPVLDLAEQVVRRRGLEERLALLLDRADLPLRPHEYVLLRLCGALAGAAVGVVLGGGVLLALILALLTWVVGGMAVRFKAAQRLKQFATQLPDGLGLMASSLQTGFSLAQALDALARDASEPLRSEVGRAVAAARLGADMEDALDRVAERMDSDDMRWTVMAIRVQRQVGGNLAETLRTTMTTLRDRSALRRHVRALSAEGRLSAYILLALPILMALVLYFMNREYLSLLWTNVLGWIMIALALVSMTIGWFWMRKVVEVEM